MQIIGLSGIANGSIDTLEDGIQMIGYNNNPSYKGVGTGTINIMNSGLRSSAIAVAVLVLVR